jgi:hypothetical protein
MSPRPPSSRRPWHPPRRVQENRITTGTSLDADRQERQRQLQEAALKGDKAAKAELVAMGLRKWVRNGKRIL